MSVLLARALIIYFLPNKKLTEVASSSYTYILLLGIERTASKFAFSYFDSKTDVKKKIVISDFRRAKRLGSGSGKVLKA